MTNKMRMEKTAKVGGKYVMHYTHLHESLAGIVGSMLTNAL